jgi:hypothetical protein
MYGASTFRSRAPHGTLTRAAKLNLFPNLAVGIKPRRPVEFNRDLFPSKKLAKMTEMVA